MEHYYLMLILSGILILLGFLTWHKTRSLAFPLGLFFLYFWSLHGAWSLITDKLGGDSGKHYHYLEEKILPIHLDDNYFWTLAFYGLFIIVVALTVLITAKPASSQQSTTYPPIVVSHSLIAVIAVLAGLFSLVIIYPSLEMARSMNVSAYSFKGGDHANLPPLYTLFEVLNRIALLPVTIGLAISASGKHPKYIAGEGGKWTFPVYLTLLALLYILSSLMGDKNQLVFTGMTAVLFYLVNAEKPRYAMLAVLGAAGILGLASIDLLRGIPLPLLYSTLTNLSPTEWTEMVQFFGNSNEAFGAHFSMYGALTFHLQPTYGTSITNLAASIVPRVFWQDRPDDIYAYYAEGVQALPGQGYTIHHAAGWYLNFGVIGIVIGAMVLGLIWTACYNRFLQGASNSSRWMQIFTLIVPWTFTAYLPMIVRAGPEVYKGVCIEAFLMPTLMLWIASLDRRRFFYRDRAIVHSIAN